MQIIVGLVSPPVVAEDVKGSNPHGPGHRYVWSENLVLEEYDGVNQNRQLAGTHSGFATTLRVAGAGDIYPSGSVLFQHEATYSFNAVPNTPLKKGQITTRGVSLIDSNGMPLDPPTILAITGGTQAYIKARGQITEITRQNRPAKQLDIDIT